MHESQITSQDEDAEPKPLHGSQLIIQFEDVAPKPMHESQITSQDEDVEPKPLHGSQLTVQDEDIEPKPLHGSQLTIQDEGTEPKALHESQPPSQDKEIAPKPPLASQEEVEVNFTMRRYSFKRNPPVKMPPPPTPMPLAPASMTMPDASFEALQKAVSELMRTNREFITKEKNKMAKAELDKAAVALGDVIVANSVPLPLLAKAQTFLHVAVAPESESSEACDKFIIITKLVNAMCTEIVQECMKSNCETNLPTTQPVHEPEDQSDLFGDFETSELLDLQNELDELHARGVSYCLHPNEAILSSLSKYGDGNCFPPNSAVCGPMRPGSSSLLASATCIH
jgi:hypothetical protein